MKYLLSILFIVLISCSSSTSDEPNVSHDSDEWQIWAYSKAAPDFIGEFATIVGGDGKQKSEKEKSKISKKYLQSKKGDQLNAAYTPTYKYNPSTQKK
jgi:hypothetical protein